ncbi:uncharacterized protein LOC125291330 [Alosa alosa]|uniref:uncharacterized protein LOC125291330 n=1 Tax=Alosa alosa TaxID=278164 RepID=UPI0020151471|nr:uncharacterized protein LOC125291330 [Alosa alosa]
MIYKITGTLPEHTSSPHWLPFTQSNLRACQSHVTIQTYNFCQRILWITPSGLLIKVCIPSEDSSLLFPDGMMAQSTSSSSAYLYLLLFFILSSPLVQSNQLDSQILDDLFAVHLDFAMPNVGEGSTEDQMPSLSSSPYSSSSSSSRHGRNLSGMEPQVAREREADSTHRWPHRLMELIGHQKKFRGRTKKSRNGCLSQNLVGTSEGVKMINLIARDVEYNEDIK